jgi:carbon-monoxide dehydrogenase medium subunit
MLLPVEKIYPCESVAQALDCLAQDREARPLAAGTDLVPMLRDGAIREAHLVDLHNVKELDYIRYEEGLLRIGAMTTHQSIMQSELVRNCFPALVSACSQIGAAQIRRRGTVGGNICHASPAADTLPVLIAADACAVIRTKEYRKTILLESFYTGLKKTALPRDALLEEITILIPEGGWRGNYYKVGGRSALTISIASVAVLRGAGTVRAAYGSMSPCVKRNRTVEEYLNQNTEADRNRLRELVGQSLSPISDIRASAEYRLEVASNLTWLGFVELEGEYGCRC